MKIAFLFLIIEDINFPEIWERYFDNNHDKVSIYCHAKSPERVKTPWLKNNIIPNLVETGWGYITNAIYNLMEEASKDPHNVKFITISESCIPLKTFDMFYNTLMFVDDIKDSYVKYLKITDYDYKERIQSQPNYQKYKFVKHLARYCLSRYHVEILLSKRDDYESFFNKMHVGDEFVLSLLHGYDHIHDFDITYDNWIATKKEYKQLTNRAREIRYQLKDIKMKFKNESNKTRKIEIYHEIDRLNKEEQELMEKASNVMRNPKTYYEITQEDIDDGIDSHSFFWRKFDKSSDIGKYYDKLIFPLGLTKLYLYDSSKQEIDNKVFVDYLKLDRQYVYFSKSSLLPMAFDRIVIQDGSIVLKKRDLESLFNLIKPLGHLIISKNYSWFFKNNFNNVSYPDWKSDNSNKSSYIKFIRSKDSIDNTNESFNFAIIGTQKGGTTALNKSIMNHPQISMPQEEEHYFDISWFKKNKIPDTYDFSKKAVGFKNPDIICNPNIYPLLYAYTPTIKVILVLRNPIKRAYSAWNMVYNEKDIYHYNYDFENAIRDEIINRGNESTSFQITQWHFLRRGLYYRQIKELEHWISHHRIMISLSHNLINDNTNIGEINKIYHFLGVDEIEDAHVAKSFQGKYNTKMDSRLYSLLLEYYRYDIQMLERYLGYSTGWLNEKG